MPSPDNAIAERIRVFVDGVSLMTATSLDVNAEKTVNKTPLIGTPEQHHAPGSRDFSGTISGIKYDSAGKRYLRHRSLSQLKHESTAWDGTQDVEIGARSGNNTQTLTETNNVYEQTITAFSDSIEDVNLNLSRTSLMQQPLQVRVYDTDGNTLLGSTNIEAIKIPTERRWLSHFIPLEDKITGLTKGSQHKITFSVESGAGTDPLVRFYGANVQDPFQVGTGDGTTTTFDLNHSGVFGDTLVVLLDGNVRHDYSISTGTGAGGVDQIVFDTAPASDAVIRASYEYDDDEFIAWRIGFVGSNEDVKYEIVKEILNRQGEVIDGVRYPDVVFSTAGTAVSPGATVEETLDFDAPKDEELFE